MNSLFERIDIADTNFRYTLDWLKRKYNEFNMKFFGNQLPKNLEFNIDHDQGRAACAGCHASNSPTGDPNEIKNGNSYISNLHITASDYLNNITEKEAAQALIHEMIHIWQYMHMPISDWANNNGHGQSFQSKMNEINNKANGEYTITVTNNLGTQARHDNDYSNKKSMYQDISNKRMLVMKEPSNGKNIAIKQFKTQSDMDNFTRTYAQMHNLEILGTVKPNDLDMYTQAFKGIKDSTPADNSGYYTISQKSLSDAENLGAIVMDK